MFLNISQHILHVVLVAEVLILLIMICTTSIPMAGRWEFHIHYRLVRKLFLLLLLLLLLLLFRIVLRRLMICGIAIVGHNISIRQRIVMTLCKLLLISIDLVQFRPHLSISSSHLSTKDVSSLRCCSWLSLNGSRSISVYLCYHLHLIWVVHDEFLGISSVGGGLSLSLSIYNFALGSNGWNFVVILLYWRKINIRSLIMIKIGLYIVDRRFRLFK